MATHVKVLAVLYLVFGGLLLLGGLVALLLFGGLASLVGFTERSPDALVAVPILGSIGGIAFLAMAALAVPCLIAGYGLLQFRPWARILTIVLSALNLVNVPFGTALGVYGLWVLLSREGERLFGGPPVSAVQPR